MAARTQAPRVVSGMSAPCGRRSRAGDFIRKMIRQTSRLKYEARQVRACHACPGSDGWGLQAPCTTARTATGLFPFFFLKFPGRFLTTSFWAGNHFQQFG